MLAQKTKFEFSLQTDPSLVSHAIPYRPTMPNPHALSRPPIPSPETPPRSRQEPSLPSDSGHPDSLSAAEPSPNQKQSWLFQGLLKSFFTSEMAGTEGVPSTSFCLDPSGAQRFPRWCGSPPRRSHLQSPCRAPLHVVRTRRRPSRVGVGELSRS